MSGVRTQRYRKKTARRKAGSWLVSAIVLVLLIALVFIAWKGFYVPWRDRQRYPLEYQGPIAAAAGMYEVDPYLLCGMIWVESRFDPEAVSSVGAVGLMQVMPETGEWVSKKLNDTEYTSEMLTQPSYNLTLGGWYLRFLLDRYQNLDTALTAYNAGQGMVDRWLADPATSADGVTLQNLPGSDAPQYASRVLRAKAEYERLYANAFAAETSSGN